MKVLRMYALVAVGLVILIGALQLLRPSVAEAPPAPAAVVVVNTPGQPVPTILQVNGPFFTRLDMPSCGSACSFQDSESPDVVVPAGKRLVIEHVSANVAVDPTLNSAVLFELIAGPDSLPVGQHVFPTVAGTNEGGQLHFTVSQPVRLYVDAGVGVHCLAHRDAAGGTFLAGPCFISGSLVNLP